MLKNNTGRPRLVSKEVVEQALHIYKTKHLTWTTIAGEFNIKPTTLRDAVRRYEAGEYDYAPPVKIDNPNIYKDTADNLDDTKLPRWNYMPPRVNIALLSRRDSWHYKPE